MPAKPSHPLLAVLERRFREHAERHPELEWSAVLERLRKRPEALAILQRMEETGGEPDVVGAEGATGALVFCDCAPESPAQRRSLCYDGAALAARKANRPTSSAMERAAELGVELLSEEQYLALQALGEFDLKTSSWLRTPEALRRLGGALFGDRRFGRVFVYHNGAESYYGARGFRGRLVV